MIWQSENSEEIFVSTSLSQVAKWTRDFFLMGQQKNIKVFLNLGKHLHSQNDYSCLGKWSPILYACHSVVQKEMRESRKWFKAGQTSTAQNVGTYAEVNELVAGVHKITLKFIEINHMYWTVVELDLWQSVKEEDMHEVSSTQPHRWA